MRGTPQQIIDKYNQLARDAQLSNDRVAAENFQQHAEHYLRLLSEAQREQDARREQQERENRDRQVQRDRERERAERQERDSNGGAEPATMPEAVESGSDVFDTSADQGESTLVETPEAAAEKPKRAPRKPRARKSDDGTAKEGGARRAKSAGDKSGGDKSGGDKSGGETDGGDETAQAAE